MPAQSLRAQPRGNIGVIMQIAGLEVRDAAAFDLALELRKAGCRHAAEWLEACVISYQPIVGFTIRDRDAILAVLADPPADLAELRGLRGVLLRDLE